MLNSSSKIFFIPNPEIFSNITIPISQEIWGVQNNTLNCFVSAIFLSFLYTVLFSVGSTNSDSVPYLPDFEVMKTKLHFFSSIKSDLSTLKILESDFLWLYLFIYEFENSCNKSLKYSVFK